VLTADGFDDAVLDRIGAELGQGPAAVRKADHGGRLISKLAENGLLVGGDPCRHAAAVTTAQPIQPVAVEGVQVSLDGVGMKREEASDGGSIPPLGMQHDRFGAAQLAAVAGGLQQLAQLPEFSGSGSAGGHGAGHGRTSAGEGQPSILPRVM
jgi:hypothetical protein